MTLLDLFTGHWTWTKLLQEIWPLILVAVSAFFAGYAYGRHKELEYYTKHLTGKAKQ
jgi:hypothetical protein